MDPWQKKRDRNGWAPSPLEWLEGNEGSYRATAHISVVFSWHLDQAYQRAAWHKAAGHRVLAGGPAVILNPDYLADVAETPPPTPPLGIPPLTRFNPNATRTSLGCIRHCSFCAVPKLEGHLVELTDWEPKPVVCDNNILAVSRAHFDRVIDRLKGIKGVDFNQGLDIRLIKKHHAERLAELNLVAARLAWDHSSLEPHFLRAWQLLRDAGFSKRRIRCYILIGYKDTPQDALHRLQTVLALGSHPYAMRYQPLNSRRRNEYIAPQWTHRELVRYCKYWNNLNHLGSIPFEEYQYPIQRKSPG